MDTLFKMTNDCMYFVRMLDYFILFEYIVDRICNPISSCNESTQSVSHSGASENVSVIFWSFRECQSPVDPQDPQVN